MERGKEGERERENVCVLEGTGVGWGALLNRIVERLLDTNI